MFVINLCASTTPVALVHPNSPELKRYTFFVTRRREEGRERFRLHMGYFDTQAQADAVLADVRDVYPAAWSGPAPGPTPGHKPATRTAPTPIDPVVLAAPPAAAPTPLAVASVEPTTATELVLSLVSEEEAVALQEAAAKSALTQKVPSLSARILPEPALELSLVADRDVATAPLAPPTSTPAAAQVAAPEAAPTLCLLEDVPRVEVATKAAADRPLSELSNVREVLALLDAAPAAQLPAAQLVATPRAARSVQAAEPVLEPAQELALLEEGPQKADLADAVIRMMTPEDTRTLRDINLDCQNKAPPCFAVQLVWSVTPIDMARLPQLAIFSAYTLYHVEGNRQGRRWYSVRLGFFTDAHAAKQVAYYMKADYRTVVVVPVAVKERERASVPLANEAPVAIRTVKPAAASPGGSGLHGFELLPAELQPAGTSAKEPLQLTGAHDEPASPVRVIGTPDGAKVLGNDAVAAQAAVLRPAKKPGGKRVVDRSRVPTRRAEPGQAQAIEATLDILGAGTLTLDEDRLKESDPARLRTVEKPSTQKDGLRFYRLLGRLTERLGDNHR
jgi:hypothetical protein